MNNWDDGITSEGLTLGPKISEPDSLSIISATRSRFSIPGACCIPWILDVLAIVLVVESMLLILGVAKAVVGLVSHTVACCRQWCLVPHTARCLQFYREDKYACFPIRRDCEGYPLNPDNLTRNVSVLSFNKEFLLNVIFFLCFPGYLVIVALQKIFPALECPTDASPEEICCSYMITKCHLNKGIPVGHPDYDSEVADTKFVMEELRKCSSGKLTGPSTRGKGGHDNKPMKRVTHNRRKRSKTNIRPALTRTNEAYREQRETGDDEVAKMMVDELENQYIVYRNFHSPIPGVMLDSNEAYSVRGFFSRAGNEYEFKVSIPLLQYWTNSKNSIDPPNNLNPNQFQTKYSSPDGVLFANELSLNPKGVVINMWYTLNNDV